MSSQVTLGEFLSSAGCHIVVIVSFVVTLLCFVFLAYFDLVEYCFFDLTEYLWQGGYELEYMACDYTTWYSGDKSFGDLVV